MPYTAEISRSNPTCFIFLVDQSSSMLEAFGSQPDKSKAVGVADAINRLLQNLVLKCAKADGIRDFFHVGMVSYGGRVVSAFGGALAGQTLVPVSKIADNPVRVEQRTRKVDDGAGGLIDQKFKFPVWFESKPTGRTPMCGTDDREDLSPGIPGRAPQLLPAAGDQYHRRRGQRWRSAGDRQGAPGPDFHRRLGHALQRPHFR